MWHVKEGGRRRQRSVAPLMLLAPALLAGCGTKVSYTPTDIGRGSIRPARAAEDVQMFLTGPPSRPFRELGYVEAQQESIYSTDDQSIVLARLRDSAALNGCDGVVVQAADAVMSGISTGKQAAPVGTARGYRGVCIVWTSGGSGSALEGALGYKFGDTMTLARNACTAAEGNWEAAEESATCDRLPRTMTFAGRVELRFCDSKLCVIDILAPFLQPTDAVVLRRWTDAKTQLEKRYGESRSGRVARPAACEGRVIECLASKQAEYRLEWKWPEGARIQEQLAQDDGKTVLQIRYASSAHRDPRSVQGL
jgi:hypothetical protein